MPKIRTGKRAVVFLTLLWLTGCASTPERVVPNEGLRVDVGAVCSAVETSPEGKMEKQEFCTYFKDQAQAEQAYKVLDSEQKGYVTREDVRKKQQALDQVIRFTTPAF
jgi:hypothetical protein